MLPPRGLTTSAIATVASPATTPNNAERRLTSSDYETEELTSSVDVWPASVSLEDDLASIAPEHDLEVTPPDRAGIAAAYRAGCRLVLERERQGLDLDL